MENRRASTTDTLLAAESGGEAVSRSLMPLVYDELRSLARRYLSQERPGHTLQPTELVHEAYLRMVDIDRVDWKGKTHFYAIAARQMRRVLVDHARARGTAKRGGGAPRLTVDEQLIIEPRRPEEILALDEALTALAEVDPRRSQVAEFRLFADLGSKEIAAEIGIAERTVRDDWRFARAWLSRMLGSPARSDGPS